MKLNNKYYILRHGEAVSNIKSVVSSWPEKFRNPLTKNGREMIVGVAKKLKYKKINIIFSSDLLRTRQTAEIVVKILNSHSKSDKSSTTFKKLKVVLDKRLREVGFGQLNSKSTEELLYLGFERERLAHGLKKSETYASVLKRVSGFLKDVDKKYKDKTILIVSHQGPLWILANDVKGFSLEEGLKRNPEEKRIGRGEMRELN